MIDLSHHISNDMQTFPKHWHIKTKITKLGRINKEHRETKKKEIMSKTTQSKNIHKQTD